MSFWEMLYTLLIGPLQLVFEIIFAAANRVTGHPGMAIIALSLIMNILVLPLYRRADSMQEEAKNIELKLKDGVAHIKRNFYGDERMMILQTYYRQNHYKPTDALNGSVSLLLEVPFFIAAYQFLAHLSILKGVSLGPILDLSMPDGLLVLGGISVNVLPVLMTVINVISSAIYLKGFPLKTKIQLYAMAVFFLVFLYTSPSGLVFYWTLNNIFSLFKNIFTKIKVSKKKDVKKPVKRENDKKVFVLSNLFLVIFIGALIPTAVVAASPQEFMNLGYYYNPLWYVANTACLAAGFFLIWMQVFYWLANDTGKFILEKCTWIFCGVSVINYMFFGTELGVLLTNLQYENGLDWKIKEKLWNLLILIPMTVVMYVLVKKARKFSMTMLLTVIIAVSAMSIYNGTTINGQTAEVKEKIEKQAMGIPNFTLSKTGKNVIVLMLDRAMGQYVPYLFQEKPELQEQFKGFTYYSNTLSYGATTNFTTPALFGGYEYTPVELNKREEDSLETKQNEALKMMPYLFSEKGYEVTICDPPYAGYEWIPDLSIFDDLPGVEAYITIGRFNDTKAYENEIKNNERNFFCYGIMKVMPLLLQEEIYDGGRYNQADATEEELFTMQVIESNMVSRGIKGSFMDNYNVLLNLPEMTHVTEEEKDTLLLMTNNTTHENIMLQEPEYEPAMYVDNTEYYTNIADRFNVDGRKLKMESGEHITHYHVNMAAFLQLGKWFDYMRENEVYDNTRIILVADHGRGLRQIEELILGDGYVKDLECYYPLLMVKDFNSNEYRESEEFMTNADVPVLAMEGLIEHPSNPYTGNKIDNSLKRERQYVIASREYDILINNGNVFLPSQWLVFEGNNIWDKNNWRFLDDKMIVPVE